MWWMCWAQLVFINKKRLAYIIYLFVQNPETRKEVLDAISNKHWDKLRGCMLQRLKFGTAGLRGRMGAGYKAMNDVVVLQTAQVSDHFRIPDKMGRFLGKQNVCVTGLATTGSLKIGQRETNMQKKHQIYDRSKRCLTWIHVI